MTETALLRRRVSFLLAAYPENRKYIQRERERAYILPVAERERVLARIEKSTRARIVAAIDTATKRIGEGKYTDKETQKALQSAIVLSCSAPRVYPFRRFEYQIGISEREFYRVKNKFARDVEKELLTKRSR